MATIIRQDKGTGDEEEIDVHELKRKLGNYYEDCELALKVLFDGQVLATPFALYRIEQYI